jgi:GlpG protein
MLCLKDLGTLIEARQSTGQMAALVLLIGVLSNIGQYFFGGPGFGGMSGVIYGLFGYIWIRGKCDPTSGLFVDPRNVMMMIVWFFLCLFQIIPHVANTAHAVGLVMGVVWGALPLGKRLFKV